MTGPMGSGGALSNAPTLSSKPTAKPTSNTNQGSVSLVEQRKLELIIAQSSKPVAKTVTDVQGKSLDDRFKDACGLLTVDGLLEGLKTQVIVAKPGIGGITITSGRCTW